MSDNPGITHSTRLERHGANVQAYVQTGVIRLDLNGLERQLADTNNSDRRIQLDEHDAHRLIGILRAAVADKEA